MIDAIFEESREFKNYNGNQESGKSE